MTTLEKIKEEFIARYPKNYANEPELGGRSCVFSLNEVLQIIDKYAEQEPKWIPVSERLPEDNFVPVLITVNGRNGLKVRSGMYYENGTFHSDTGDFWTREDNGVIAWMLLPEPYGKGGE